ncbi:MAG TPA: RNA polymerase [Gemmatimonas aurantiaca]|uniref:RNA polymerase ECF-type sigma factor n=2 Tax=Gemmatimonas aurantiaca TaxID=173480 RepID=C1A3R5_GEMAT|nr:sigma-70 family RNA polymerase sigma factor [Gemmatimonas aurantiaca]BAH37142.1 RNA polymerase ECF-type sigma factor [Gemmatimonas aurantiaca T-27]HCT58825.1 RNA polymerase [Gemmatimonas aurantiaca]
MTDLRIAREAALLEGMRRGEHDAAAALYDLYSPMLLALALRICGQQPDAEEVVLDTFMQAWRDAHRYDASRATVAGWLTTIARSRALDHVRARVRRQHASDAAEQRHIDEPMIATILPADSALEHAEQGAAVRRAMASLSDKQRCVIELAFYEGLTHAEIATRLMEPLGTIKTRIRLGMTRLRDALGPLAVEGHA